MKQFFKYFTSALFVLTVLVPQTIMAQEQADLFLTPDHGSYQVNDEFSVDLKINSEEPVTSLKAYLDFNPDLLTITGIETNGSVFPYWWEQDFNQNGKLKLQASTPLPGFSGEGGLAATIKFLAKKNGEADITYDSSSLVLKYDDENILSLANSAQASFVLLGNENGLTLKIVLITLVVLALTGVGLFLLPRKKSTAAKRK